jgi:pentatricopeptide repeat protein
LDTYLCNQIVGAFIKKERIDSAMGVLQLMNKRGLKPDAYTYSSLLNGCSKTSSLKYGKMIHAQILQSGVKQNVITSNALIKLYVKCGCINDAMDVFKTMIQEGLELDNFTYSTLLAACANTGDHERGMIVYENMVRSNIKQDLITKRTLIRLFTKCHLLDLAMTVFKSMIQEHLSLDVQTCSILISACADASDMEDGKFIHDYMKKTKMPMDVILATNLIKLYCKCRCLDDAMLLLEDMLKTSLKPDYHTYTIILSACSEMRALEHGKYIHMQMKQSGMMHDVIVLNSLLKMYVNCNEFDEAIAAFRIMIQARVVPDNRTYSILFAGVTEDSFNNGKFVLTHMLQNGTIPDLITKNALLQMYAKCKQIEDAMNLFKAMTKEKPGPDSYTYAILFSACADAENLEYGKLIHYHMQNSGMTANEVVMNSLIKMYSKFHAVEEGMAVWTAMIHNNHKPDDITLSILVSACAKVGALEHGRTIQKYMENNGEQSAIVFSALAKLYAQCNSLEEFMGVIKSMAEKGLECDCYTYSIILSACADAKALSHGKFIHDRMAQNWETQDTVSKTALIRMYAKCSCMDDAMILFRSVIGDKGFAPDEHFYSILLDGCADRGKLSYGVEVHKSMKLSGISPNQSTLTALLHMYARCGSIEESQAVFEEIRRGCKNIDVIMWTSMILAHGIHGQGLEALKLLHEMQDTQVLPNTKTIVAALTACGHSGLVDEARKLLQSMEEKFAIKPENIHYNCVIDALARSGNLSDAEKMILAMPEPDAFSWMSLLGPSRNYGDTERGERAVEALRELAPDDASVRVALASLYSKVGRKSDAVDLWNEMKTDNIKKTQVPQR